MGGNKSIMHHGLGKVCMVRAGAVPQDCVGQVTFATLAPSVTATVRASPAPMDRHATRGICILLHPGPDPQECLGYKQPAFPPSSGQGPNLPRASIEVHEGDLWAEICLERT